MFPGDVTETESEKNLETGTPDINPENLYELIVMQHGITREDVELLSKYITIATISYSYLLAMALAMVISKELR